MNMPTKNNPYLIGIPFVNGRDLLRKAVDSIHEYWPFTVIIDNSLELNAQEWPVEVFKPCVPLSLAQSLNWLFERGIASNVDAIGFMHHDAEAQSDTASRLLLKVQELGAVNDEWGVVFTHYDTLCFFNTEAIRSVGNWDVSLPHYCGDCDYYRRLRLAGFHTVPTDMPVLHQNNGSNTVKKSSAMVFKNGINFPLHLNYYQQKWGGRPNDEKFDHPFNWACVARFASVLRDADLGQRLSANYQTVEGTFLEHADERTHYSQLETLRWLVSISGAAEVIETGTAKGYFGYILSQLIESGNLTTFDGDPRSLGSAEILNAMQTAVKVRFVLGDSKVTLPQYEGPPPDLAWVDGGHDYETARSDIRHMIRLKSRWIAIDDTKCMPQVDQAVCDELSENIGYRRVKNPYWSQDGRGISVMRRVTR